MRLRAFNPVKWAAEASRSAIAASTDWTLVVGHVGLLAGLLVAATWSFGAYQRSL
jgi:hypothetical protein